jgi:hypothetical protein
MQQNVRSFFPAGIVADRDEIENPGQIISMPDANLIADDLRNSKIFDVTSRPQR